MTHQFPDVYTPEKPYDMTMYCERKANIEPKHIYKLMGSLYEEKPQPEEEVDPDAPRKAYESRVLRNAENSNKKVRCASSRAQKTTKAMGDTIDDCRGIQKKFKSAVKQLNTTCRRAFLNALGTSSDEIFKVPIEWLEDEECDELRERMRALTSVHNNKHGSENLGFGSSALKAMS